MNKLSRRQVVTDTAVAAGVLLTGFLELSGVIPGTVFPGSDRVNAVFVVLVAAPLVLRRVYPLSMMLVVVAVTTVWQYALYRPDQQQSFAAFIALLIVVFGAGAITAGRTARAALVTVVLGSMLTAIDIIAGKPLGTAIPPMLMIVGVFVLGRLLAGYRAQAEAAAVRADRISREHEAEREAAVREERARIARELHDVITHDVSLIVMQASVERRLGDAATAGTLASIEETGRDALAELRRMLGVLRSPEPNAPLRPQPGLGQLGDLVAQCRDAGIEVRLVAPSEPIDLPPGLGLAAYRIVQESLTNVLKHAGRTRVVVTIQQSPDCLELEIVDEGPGAEVPARGGVWSAASAAPVIDGRQRSGLPSGHGLDGMRERVALYGGSVESGPRRGGRGYRVHVMLPRARVR